MWSTFFQPRIVQCLGLATLDKEKIPPCQKDVLFSPYRKVVAVSRSHNNNKVKCVKWDGRGEEWDYVCHIEFARYHFFSFSSCWWVSDLTSNIIKTKVFNITYRLIMCHDVNQNIPKDRGCNWFTGSRLSLWPTNQALRITLHLSMGLMTQCFTTLKDKFVCQSSIILDWSKVWFLSSFLSWHLNSVMCYEQTNI